MASVGDQTVSAPSKRSSDADSVDTPPKRLCTVSTSFPSSVPLPRSVVENSPPKSSKTSPAFPSSIPMPFLRDKVLPPEDAPTSLPAPAKFWLPPAVQDYQIDAEERRERRDKKEKKEKKHNKHKSAQELPRRVLDHRRLFKVGQKNITPPIADATRAFYTSLFEENPESKIAIKYLVENGVLPLEEHRRLHKKYEIIKDKEADAKRSKPLVRGIGSRVKSSKFARHTQQAKMKQFGK